MYKRTQTMAPIGRVMQRFSML